MRGKVENSLDLFASKAVKHLHDFIDGEPIFKVFEHRGRGNSGAAKDPRPADFAGYAFDRVALRPIEGHNMPFRTILPHDRFDTFIW